MRALALAVITSVVASCALVLGLDEGGRGGAGGTGVAGMPETTGSNGGNGGVGDELSVDWQSHIRGPSEDAITDLAIGEEGRLLATGSLCSTAVIGSQATGNVTCPSMWGTQFDSMGVASPPLLLDLGSEGTAFIAPIFEDASSPHGAVIAGTFGSNTVVTLASEMVEETGGREDIYIARMGNDLSVAEGVWIAGFGEDTKAERILDVATDLSGDIYIVGLFESGAAFSLGGGSFQGGGGTDPFVAKFDPSGQHLWSYALPGNGPGSATSVDVGSDGEVVVAGWFSDTIQFPDSTLELANAGANLFVAVFGTDGEYRRQLTFGNDEAQMDIRAHFLSTSNIALAMHVNGSMSVADVDVGVAGERHLALVDVANTDMWTHHLSRDFGRVTSGEFLIDVVAGGPIAIAGTFDGRIELDRPIDSGGQRVAFVGALDPATFESLGSHLVFASSGDVTARAMVSDGTAVFFGVDFEGTLDLPSGPLSSDASQDAVLLRVALD